MSLHILVARERWQEFDQAWNELKESGAPIEELITALRHAGDKKRGARCTQQAREHAKALEAAGRNDDAARLLGATLVSGGNPSEIGEDLLRTAEAAWKSESWWETYRDQAGLTAESHDLRAAWGVFSRLLALQPGRIVYHPGGWGSGEVQEVDLAEREVHVVFATGKHDRFPMNAAVEIFQSLPETDLRALHFRDADGLRKRAKAEPLEILRTIVETHHGKVTTAQIRNALASVGIEGSAWSAWWRKARKLAENSEWFEVSGSPQKSVIALLLTAKDPTETLRKQLMNLSDLGEVNARVRELFIGQKVDPALKEVGLEILENFANAETEPLHERLAAWLLLREQRGETPEALTMALAEVLDLEPPTDPSIAPELWKLFQSLGSSRDQERAVSVLPELYGEAWVEEAATHLPHSAPGMVRPLVDELQKGGHQDELLVHYAGLLARPLRAPTLLVSLCKLFENQEVLPDGLPTGAQRAHALVTLASLLFEGRRGDAHLTRVHTRMVDLLTGGKPPLLHRLLQDADTIALRGLQMVMQRGVDDAIDHVVTDVALSRDRNFFANETGPFWQSDTIWTTRSGMERRSAELRELREVKIPENEDAIGRAASYGDLSENAEWEAAIEEQRNLTSRAMEIEAELRSAELLENANLLEDTVCPGTIVRYREIADDKRNEIMILGPWDSDLADNVVSYRAPLAAGLLGMHVGESKVVELPSGKVELEVLEIEVTEFI